MKKEPLINVKLEKGIEKEINEAMDQLQELFNTAWDLNMSDNTRSDFTRKVTTYVSGIQQTLSYIKQRVKDSEEVSRHAYLEDIGINKDEMPSSWFLDEEKSK